MATNQERFDELIGGFQRQCETWKSKNPTMDFVFNKKLLYPSVDITKIQYIIVADNPGDNELKMGEYLYDCTNDKKRSGYIAHEAFRQLSLSEESFLVLNKTPIYTSESEELKKYKDGPVLSESMEYMAKLAFDINLLNPKVQTIIFGIGGSFDTDKEEFDEKDLFAPYYKKLAELYLSTKKTNLTFPIISKHFSHYSFLQDFCVEDDGAGKQIKYCEKKLKFRDLSNFKWNDFFFALETLPYSDWLKDYKNFKEVK